MAIRDNSTGPLGVPPNSRRARRRGALVIAVLAFTLAACTRLSPQGPQPYSPAYAGDVLNAAYTYIADRYIEPFSLRKFTIDGLHGLQEIEPGFQVRHNGRSIDVLVNTALVLRQPAPSEHDDNGWAALSLAAIEASRDHSAALAAADPEVIFKALFDSALVGLDDFSRYAGADEAKDFRASREGFGGIGISVRMGSSDAHIMGIEERSPAAAAGLAADDRITRIDGESIAGWTQGDLVRTLRGQIGTSVRLTIAREALPSAFELTLTRARIVPSTVTVQRRGSAAIIRVSSFNQRTGPSLAETISRLRRSPAGDLTGLVLDLRGNPGGLLDQAVEVADVFLSDGEIVLTRGRHPHSMQRFAATGSDMSGGLPLIVLVNGNSASASEVVAAALQDLGRAVVIGSNSYGKGTVQTVYRLPNDGELTLTWSRLYAPSGYRLQGLGVLPTVCSRDYGETPAASIGQALRTGEGRTQQALPRWRQVTSGDRTQVEGLRGLCPSDSDVSQRDLELATTLIGDPALYSGALAGGGTALATVEPAQ